MKNNSLHERRESRILYFRYVAPVRSQALAVEVIQNALDCREVAIHRRVDAGFGVWVLRFGFWVLGFGFGFWGLGFGFQGIGRHLGLRVRGVGCRE